MAAVGVVVTRLGTMGLVSCMGDGAMQWQIRLHTASGVMVGEWQRPSSVQGEGMAVML